MITEQAKALILDALKKHADELGLDIPIVVEDYYDAMCTVPVPKEIANSRDEDVAELSDRMAACEFLKECYDKGRGQFLRGAEVRQFEITVADGYWTHSEVDEKIEEEEMSVYYDQDKYKAWEAQQLEEKKKYWKEYIIPIPPPPKKCLDELYLTMAFEPYDQIKSGEKVTEFRQYNKTWVKRILSHPLKTVKFQRGYGGPGLPPPEQMVWSIKKIYLYEMDNKMEGDPWNPPEGIVPTFIAIDLGERIS